MAAKFERELKKASRNLEVYKIAKEYHLKYPEMDINTCIDNAIEDVSIREAETKAGYR